MNRYIAVTILALALLAGSIWHGTARAQRITRFPEGVQIYGASSPYLHVIDTTNSAQTILDARDSIGAIGMTSNHALYFLTNNATEMMISAAGDVGVGTIDPEAGFHGVVTDGVYLWGNVETDNTDKRALAGVEHYDVDDKPFYFTKALTTISANTLTIGGGSSGGNAATLISFNTTANNTTHTGTEVARIDGDGYFYFTDRLIDLGDTDTYIGSTGANYLHINVGGANRTAWTTTAMTVAVPIDVAGQYLSFTERADPGDPGAGKVYMFAYDDSGTSKICFHFEGASSVYCPIADPIP